MKKILFLDDELERVYPYVTLLNSKFGNYTILPLEDPNDAKDYFQQNHDFIALCICDIMFGTSAKHEYSGIEGGIEFYDNIKTLYPSIPFIILTNRKLPVLKKFTELIRSHNDVAIEKILIPPIELIKIVKKILSHETI